MILAENGYSMVKKFISIWAAGGVIAFHYLAYLLAKEENKTPGEIFAEHMPDIFGGEDDE